MNAKCNTLKLLLMLRKVLLWFEVKLPFTKNLFVILHKTKTANNDLQLVNTEEKLFRKICNFVKVSKSDPKETKEGNDEEKG